VTSPLQAQIDALRTTAIGDRSLVIDGALVDADDGGRRDVISPLDGSRIATLAEGTRDDVDRAVAASRRSFDAGVWSRRSPQERMQVMHRLADLIDEHATQLAVLGVRDNGTEIAMAIRAEPGSAAKTIRYYAESIDKVYGQIAPTAEGILGLITYEPVGVVGVIVPWTFPLMIGSWKIGAALAAGNSVVVKPPETASLTLLRLTELALEAGVPPGVVNCVTGSGAVVGDALARHMDVDVVAFTGSGATGRRLLEASAQSNLKRVYLELGGKSPNIVFDDAADLASAATAAVSGIFRNSGQVCVSGSRLLVQSSIYDEFVAQVCEVASKLRVGDPLSLDTQVGAVHSAGQLAKNLDMVSAAVAAGETVRLGGGRVHESSGGYFMEPTVFDRVDPASRLAQEEVFGPVLAVIPFADTDDAIRIANDTIYGLAAGVWTSNLSTAHRVSRQVKAGNVYVNTYGGADITTPLAGMKQSGNGADRSLHAIDKFTNLKTVWMHAS
jgi:gamma-glutamyl-gamma-aminobutyraldehyde dehydrogenase